MLRALCRDCSDMIHKYGKRFSRVSVIGMILRVLEFTNGFSNIKAEKEIFSRYKIAFQKILIRMSLFITHFSARYFRLVANCQDMILLDGSYGLHL